MGAHIHPCHCLYSFCQLTNHSCWHGSLSLTFCSISYYCYFFRLKVRDHLKCPKEAIDEKKKFDHRSSSAQKDPPFIGRRTATHQNYMFSDALAKVYFCECPLRRRSTPRRDTLKAREANNFVTASLQGTLSVVCVSWTRAKATSRGDTASDLRRDERRDCGRQSFNRLRHAKL